MSVPEILKTIAESFQSSATVKNVYGEPVVSGDRTVIPVARISFGYGGGGGDGQQGGGGGGGRMSATAAGLVEITPDGTRFLPLGADWRKLASVAAVSFGLGLLIGTRRRR